MWLWFVCVVCVWCVVCGLWCVSGGVVCVFGFCVWLVCVVVFFCDLFFSLTVSPSLKSLTSLSTHIITSKTPEGRSATLSVQV